MDTQYGRMKFWIAAVLETNTEAMPARIDEPQKLAVRRKPARRTDRRDLGQPDQQLPPPRDGSATLLHATADESSLVAGK